MEAVFSSRTPSQNRANPSCTFKHFLARPPPTQPICLCAKLRCVPCDENTHVAHHDAWAELRGGAKRTEEHNLARMVFWNHFGDPPKAASGGRLREILGMSKGMTKSTGKGAGVGNVLRRVGRNLFSARGLLARFCPPLLLSVPPWRSLGSDPSSAVPAPPCQSMSRLY